MSGLWRQWASVDGGNFERQGGFCQSACAPYASLRGENYGPLWSEVEKFAGPKDSVFGDLHLS
jgi:hypothetical protein